LEDLFGWQDPSAFGLLVHFAATSTLAYGLVDEITRSAEGISQRVHAVKEYAYLDQAPVQPVDVHHALETTLVMLRHKLKPSVTVRREYAPDVPRIDAYGSELNQVWTNLIDNALDAMGDQGGELVLRTARANGSIRVEITDTGSGILPEVLPRIFDVGFTTKPPGEGTGRGLHIARNIIEDKHRGKIAVTSQPGQTRFEVTLPIELRRR
jgi:signal transduction histidine kinase